MFQERNPKLIIVLSGKRKSGKDYIAGVLEEKFGSNVCEIIRLSSPLKKQYAVEHNLNYERLLDSSEYKETFRKKMIEWGEDVRNRDPGYFCRHAIQLSQRKDIWIVSDARRRSDVKFFLDHYPNSTCTVRISASEPVRKDRGLVFTKGVDDCESECGLDDYAKWDFHVKNDDQKQLTESLSKLFALGLSRLT